MNNIQVFIDIDPPKDKKICKNCKSFNQIGWGVTTGYCTIKKINKQQTQRCKSFDPQ